MKRAHLLCLAMASAILGFSAPAQAQDGLIMRNIFGKIGILPEEKDPIEYRERPGLVVPKDTNKLRPPEPGGVHAKNGQWPVDPDVKAREDEKRRRNLPQISSAKGNAEEGGALGVDAIARGRSVRGAKTGEQLSGDKDNRLSVQEMLKSSQAAATPTYPPGTEPPRKYLTDPPVGSRIPSANAAMRRTVDGPGSDDFKKDGAPHRPLE